MHHDKCLEVFTAESATMVDAVAAGLAELEQPIEFLGEWTARDLVAHTGLVYAMVAANVAAADASEPTRPGDERKAPEGDAIAEWFGERRQVTLDLLSAAAPDAPAWTFGSPKTAGWWARRMVHETVVHRWDLQCGLGVPEPIESDVAADGVAEFLEVQLPRASAFPAETLHLHRTDGVGEWMVARGETEADVVVTQEHGKGAAAIRGSAPALVLWVWGRPTEAAGGVKLFGDPAVAQAWQTLAP